MKVAVWVLVIRGSYKYVERILLALYVQFNNHTLTTPGLGASIAVAAAMGDYPALLAATLLMAAVVVIINRSVWRRLYALEEAQAQLQTAINWGRYAELFAFQEDRGMFRLEEEEEPLTRPVS